ncbi:MAG: hypothetical protein ABSA59_02440 [Terriglobia bacterium]|jgi:hypothetical protein
MAYRALYLFVEGDDDERFARTVISPRLSKGYDWIDTFRYAQEKPAKVSSYLRNIKSTGAEYFLLADINSCPCFPERRQILLKKFRELEHARVIIVVKEIEGWYLAGVPANSQWGVSVPGDTTNLTKEQFDAALPKPFNSRTSYMVEILKLFDVDTAGARNPSFQYFARRCGLLGPSGVR